MVDLIGLCDVCGKPGAMVTCNICGRLVCTNCYDKERCICNKCRIGNF